MRQGFSLAHLALLILLVGCSSAESVYEYDTRLDPAALPTAQRFLRAMYVDRDCKRAASMDPEGAPFCADLDGAWRFSGAPRIQRACESPDLLAPEAKADCVVVRLAGLSGGATYTSTGSPPKPIPTFTDAKARVYLARIDGEWKVAIYTYEARQICSGTPTQCRAVERRWNRASG